jgi:hypothetical protein
VEANTPYPPVRLRISALCARKHNVKYKKREQYPQHSDKFYDRRRRNVAVLFSFDCLHQSRNHNAQTQEIADIGKMHVKIPANYLNIVKNPKACNAAYKP